MSDIVERLNERLKLAYIGNCKCGHCHLVEDRDIWEASATITALREEVERMREGEWVYLVYDWAWTDETGQQLYARTPERAERLAKAGHKLTPVYTRERRQILDRALVNEMETTK